MKKNKIININKQYAGFKISRLLICFLWLSHFFPAQVYISNGTSVTVQNNTFISKNETQETTGNFPHAVIYIEKGIFLSGLEELHRAEITYAPSLPERKQVYNKKKNKNKRVVYKQKAGKREKTFIQAKRPEIKITFINGDSSKSSFILEGKYKIQGIVFTENRKKSEGIYVYTRLGLYIYKENNNKVRALHLSSYYQGEGNYFFNPRPPPGQRIT
ncbi:hypothetical protein [Chryseobacterium sp. CT-SW4]|uniref:hypothetical protein n=1 Tax=Chryseobacterium sp. SW-1 TaxID=3157343 RepID=UPI003B01E4F1